MRMFPMKGPASWKNDLLDKNVMVAPVRDNPNKTSMKPESGKKFINLSRRER